MACTCFVFLVLAAVLSRTASKCLDSYNDTKSYGSSGTIVLLMSLTHSNGRYDMQNILKEVYYRKHRFKDFSVLSFDVCNDRETVSKVFLELLLNGVNGTYFHFDLLFLFLPLELAKQALMFYHAFDIFYNKIHVNQNNGGSDLKSDESNHINTEMNQTHVLKPNLVLFLHETPTWHYLFNGLESHIKPETRNGYVIYDADLNRVEYVLNPCRQHSSNCTCEKVVSKETHNFYFTQWNVLHDFIQNVTKNAKHGVLYPAVFNELLGDMCCGFRPIPITSNKGILQMNSSDCRKAFVLDAKSKSILCKATYDIEVYLGQNEVSINALGYYIPTRNSKDTCLPYCGKGHAIRKEFVHQNKGYYVTWKCFLCSGNSIKPVEGNHNCTYCEIGWKSDPSKTFCYDTFKNLTLKFEDGSSVLMLSLSGTVFSAIAGTMFIFIRYRYTPVVKSSGWHKCLVQLFMQFMLTVNLPLLFIGDPNRMVCVLRPVIIGFFLTMQSVIMLLRTQLLLHIFNAKTRVSKTDKLVTRVSQVVTTLILLMIYLAILIISFRQRLPAVIYDVSTLHKHRVKHCNSDVHVIAQLLYVALLMLINSVQSFRARHLPANLKETRNIVIASILSCVWVGNMLMFYIALPNQYWKAVALYYVVLILNIIIFVFQYAQKVYVLCFRPELNTPEFFYKVIRMKVAKTSLATLMKQALAKEIEMQRISTTL